MSSFASKTNLAALKTEVDKLDTDKLKTTPADLAKLTNVVDSELVKKTVYNAKATAIDNEISGVKQSATNNLAEITKLKKIILILSLLEINLLLIQIRWMIKLIK